jgi:type IV secretion system protein TrbE
MVKSSRIIKDYREAGAFNALVNVQAAVNDNTFLTKSGDLFCVLKATGIDYEGRDPDQLDAMCRRFQSALPILDERFRIYQYLTKREGAPIPFQAYPDNPVLHQAVANRIDFFRQKASSLFAMDIHFVVVYEGAFGLTGRRWENILSRPLESLRELLFTPARISAIDRDLRIAQERLSGKLRTFIVQLQDSVNLTVLGKDAAFRFLSYLLNLTPHKASVGLRFDSFVDYQACGSTLECHRDHLRLDDRYIKVLTLKQPPSRTFAHMLRGLQEIASDYVMVTEWRPEGNARVRRLIQGKRRHFHNSKASLLNYVNTTPSGVQDTLIDDAALAVVKDLGGALEELELKGNAFGQFSMTVVLHDPDLSRLKRSVADCFKVFAAHDAQLIEERYNLLNGYLATIPGNHLFNLRRMWLLSTNYSDLSFLFTIRTGEVINEHLRAEYLAVLETNHGTPYYLNLHHQDVAHSVILGATGSGKSFLLNFLITHAQKYKPLTFIFDIGRGYENLARLFGGSFLPIGTEDRPFTINPFVLPPTPDNLRFLFSLVMVLVGSNGYAPTAAEEKDLYEQIENLYVVEPAQRRLFTLANVLGRNLRAHLQKWVHPGPFASLFDNAEDTLTFSRFQVFDFEGMANSPQMLEALLFYILHRANAVILDESQATTFKLFPMDEVWRFLQHPTIRQYILEALKTWRKKNAAIILATQSTDDLIHSNMLNVVVESCPTKMFLANPGMNRESYRSAFHLSETETDLIAGLIPKRQLLLKRPNLAKILNLEVDRKGYWIYTNDPYDNEKKREAFDRYGFEGGLENLIRSSS